MRALSPSEFRCLLEKFTQGRVEGDFGRPEPFGIQGIQLKHSSYFADAICKADEEFQICIIERLVPLSYVAQIVTKQLLEGLCASARETLAVSLIQHLSSCDRPR